MAIRSRPLELTPQLWLLMWALSPVNSLLGQPQSWLGILEFLLGAPLSRVRLNHNGPLARATPQRLLAKLCHVFLLLIC